MSKGDHQSSEPLFIARAIGGGMLTLVTFSSGEYGIIIANPPADAVLWKAPDLASCIDEFSRRADVEELSKPA